MESKKLDSTVGSFPKTWNTFEKYVDQRENYEIIQDYLVLVILSISSNWPQIKFKSLFEYILG